MAWHEFGGERDGTGGGQARVLTPPRRRHLASGAGKGPPVRVPTG